MSSFCEEFELALNSHEIGFCVVHHFDALDDFVDIFFDCAFSPQVALVVQGRLTDVANVLGQVLPDAVRQSLHVVVVPQLFHHETAGFKATVVIFAGVGHVLPIDSALKVV